MEYVCKVGMPSGEVVERTFTADDEAALRADMEQKGLYLFSLARQGGGEIRLRPAHIKTDTLLMFCQELAALLKAGLPLLQSLDVLLERQKNPTFRKSLAAVRDRIRSGVSISDAFKAEGPLYPGIFSASLVAGERSGNLEGVIRRFVQYLRLSQGMKKKAVAAAVYPAVLLVLMLGLVAILVTFVIPQFAGFYEGLGGELPLPTQILLGTSNFIRSHILILAAIVVGLGSFVTVWMRRESSMLLIDGLLLRVPVLGPMMRMYATSQFARTLATLLSGGLPLLSALTVAAASIGNRAMAAAVAQGATDIREGRSLTTALESTHMVDNMALEMVKVGEQTGALADMLNALADFYDEDMDTRLSTVMGLIEPLLLVIMAVVVAGMLIAFYLPMFQVFGKIK